jgi:hypothetical protein
MRDEWAMAEPKTPRSCSLTIRACTTASKATFLPGDDASRDELARQAVPRLPDDF